MAKEQNKFAKYPSKYAQDTWVSAAQYIAEIMCERRGQSLNRDLPNHFWNLPEWKQFYFYQLSLARKLLEEFDPKAVIGTLLQPEFKFVYSLKLKKLRPAIVEANKIIRESFLVPKKPEEKAVDNAMHKRDIFKKPNTIDRLKELE
jgi:hypothetical protein